MQDDKPEAKQALKKGAAAETKSASPADSSRAEPANSVLKRRPAATVRALKELEDGELNRYADADELLSRFTGRSDPS